jgi:two-component system, NarL family, nitrate/nitrite response regulator NarL
MELPENALRVVLADDHHFFREGLRGMLTADGIAVVGEASDGASAIELTSELAPDVVVLDLNMPGISGTEAIEAIAQASPRSQVIVLTVSTDERDVLEAVAHGACAYLLKDTRVDELVASIRLAASGHAVLSREVLRALAAHVPARDHEHAQRGRGSQLTPRELEVIRLIAEGADNATIGRELSISPHTVKQYVTNIFGKLGVNSRVEVAVHAVRSGLV